MQDRTAVREEHGQRSLNERLAGSLREIVYGGNDGIVTTFAVVAGFAGAASDGVELVGPVAVLLFGLANLFADATAMGLGAFLSARAARDAWRNARSRKRATVGAAADGGRAQVTRAMAARGLGAEEASAIADLYHRHPELVTDLLMQAEDGMADPGTENAALTAAATFVSFVVFGAIPLLPYIIDGSGPETFAVSVAATFGALALLGLLRWQVTRQGLARAVGETLLVGGTCALVAYGVGTAFRA